MPSHTSSSSAPKIAYLGAAVAGAALLVGVLAAPPTVIGAQGDCSQPISTGADPTSSDCLAILRKAVNLAVPGCDPECICAPAGSLPAAPTDALACLRRATKLPQELDCPCPISMEGPPPLAFLPVAGGSVSQQIPAAAGGTLTADAATLEIPIGALPEDTTVTMTIMRDESGRDHTILAMFEPDGLALHEPATLVISLDSSLPEGAYLNVLVFDSADPDHFVDTGLFAEVSEDRTEVRIPIEHFSGAACADLNCHGHSLRNIIQALLSSSETPMTKDQMIDEVCATVGDRKSAVVKNEAGEFLELCEVVKQDHGRLFRTDKCVVKHEGLEAYLNTFYTLTTVRVDADYNGELLKPGKDCLTKLDALTRSAGLPPILNFGTRFTIGNHPDTDIDSEAELVFYDSIPHSAPLIVRGDTVVIENGLSLSSTRAAELAEAREGHPAAAQEIPRVAAVDLSDLERFRTLKSGVGMLEEFRKWDPNKEINTGNTVPWAAVRIWVPKGTDPGLCDLDLEFPVTYTGPGSYQSSVSFDFGEMQSATCGAETEYSVTLHGDGTLSAQWDITETVQTIPTLGIADCFTYDEPVTVTRRGTHADGRFEWLESTVGSNRNVTGAYDSSSLGTDPTVWSNSYDRTIHGSGGVLGIQSWTVSKSFSLSAHQ